jgi:hypothetical protein
MELITGNAELLGPISDVRSHLGVDDFRVVRTFRVVFMEGVGLVGLGAVVVLRHCVHPFCQFYWWMCSGCMRMYSNGDNQAH